MPYIPTKRREALEAPLRAFIEERKGSDNLDLCACVLLILSAYEDAAKPSEEFYFSEAAIDLRDALEDLTPNVGDLNYTITRFLEGAVIEDEVRYSKLNRCAGVMTTLRVSCAPILGAAMGERYTMNRLIDCLGVLRCCEHEFLRRLHDVYEDAMIEKNGDCFKHYSR